MSYPELGLDYGSYMDDYLYSQRMKYLPQGNQGYYNQNGGVDTPLFSNYNNSAAITNNGYTCTDGENDGKLGLSVVYYAGKGVVKGAINGIKGMFTDSSGKFSLAKTLGTVALGAACIACPALGAVACGIGAVAGGAQLVNGIKNVAEAKNNKSDAQAKEAWENIGEGASTVVGCVAGAAASVGAMKAASTAAKLSSIDDIGKFLGNTDDIAKALGNTDDMAKALKAHGINNTDEVLKALDGIDNMDEAMKAITSTGKTSALGAVDDTLTGTKKAAETLKAAGKDAMSSSRNNVGKVWNKATSTIDDVNDYRKAKAQYNKAKTANDEAAEEFLKAQEQLDQDIVDAARTKVGKTSDELAAAKAKMDATQTGQKVNARAKVQSDIDIQRKNVQAKQAELNDAIKAAKESDEVKNIKGITKGKERQTKIDEIVQPQQKALDAAKTAEKQAKSQTTFGKLKTNAADTVTNSETYTSFTEMKTKIKEDGFFKSLNKETLTKLGNSLSNDSKEILAFLQSDKTTYAQAVQKYGWHNVSQVLQAIYGLNQTGMAI